MDNNFKGKTSHVSAGVQHFFTQNKDALLTDFFTLLGFKSISTDIKFRANLLLCAKWLGDYVKSIGFEDVVFVSRGKGDGYKVTLYKDIPIQGSGLVKHFPEKHNNPVVVGVYNAGQDYPWVMVYGHYDVQPVDKDKWATDPFKPVERNGKIFARGASDNKGRFFANLVGLQYLIKSKSLKYNVVIVLEGEEEIAGDTVKLAFEYVKDKYGVPKISYINDVTWFANEKPSIMYSVRGVVAFELLLETGTQPVHSGLYGNIVLNAGNLASYVGFKLKDVIRNRIRIDRLHRLVRKPSIKEIRYLSSISPSWSDVQQSSNTYFVTKYNRKGKEFLPIHLIGLRPSLDINGIQAGFTEKGKIKMIIPNKAILKFSIRTVPHLTSEKVIILVHKYINRILKKFKGIKYTLNVLAEAPYAWEDPQSPLITQTKNIMEDVFNRSVFIMPHGASNLAAGAVKSVFGDKTTLLMPGIGKPSHNIHAPNENIEIEMILNGAEILTTLLKAG